MNVAYDSMKLDVRTPNLSKDGLNALRTIIHSMDKLLKEKTDDLKV